MFTKSKVYGDAIIHRGTKQGSETCGSYYLFQMRFRIENSYHKTLLTVNVICDEDEIDTNVIQENFNEAIAPVLKFAQYFALMPVENVSDLLQIKFQWKSLKAIFSLLHLSYGVFTTIIFINLKIWIQKENEAGLLKHPYKIHGWRLATKLRCTALAVICLAFGIMLNEKKDTKLYYLRMEIIEIEFIF